MTDGRVKNYGCCRINRKLITILFIYFCLLSPHILFSLYDLHLGFLGTQIETKGFSCSRFMKKAKEEKEIRSLLPILLQEYQIQVKCNQQNKENQRRAKHSLQQLKTFSFVLSSPISAVAYNSWNQCLGPIAIIHKSKLQSIFCIELEIQLSFQ